MTDTGIENYHFFKKRPCNRKAVSCPDTPALPLEIWRIVISFATVASAVRFASTNHYLYENLMPCVIGMYREMSYEFTRCANVLAIPPSHKRINDLTIFNSDSMGVELASLHPLIVNPISIHLNDNMLFAPFARIIKFYDCPFNKMVLWEELVTKISSNLLEAISIPGTRYGSYKVLKHLASLRTPGHPLAAFTLTRFKNRNYFKYTIISIQHIETLLIGVQHVTVPLSCFDSLTFEFFLHIISTPRLKSLTLIIDNDFNFLSTVSINLPAYLCNNESIQFRVVIKNTCSANNWLHFFQEKHVHLDSLILNGEVLTRLYHWNNLDYNHPPISERFLSSEYNIYWFNFGGRRITKLLPQHKVIYLDWYSPTFFTDSILSSVVLGDISPITILALLQNHCMLKRLALDLIQLDIKHLQHISETISDFTPRQTSVELDEFVFLIDKFHDFHGFQKIKYDKIISSILACLTSCKRITICGRNRKNLLLFAEAVGLNFCKYKITLKKISWKGKSDEQLAIDMTAWK